MSFGFGVGDIISVTTLALQVYKICTGSSKDFQQLGREVASLHSILKLTEDHIANGSTVLDKTRQDELSQIANGCRKVLTDIEMLLQKYEKLGNKTRWTWDHVGWGTEDIQGLRERIRLNVTLLTAFNTTIYNLGQNALMNSLNALMDEVRRGQRKNSFKSAATAASSRKTVDDSWQELQRKLEGMGITERAVKTHRDFIIKSLTDALARGALEKDALHSPNPDTGRSSSPVNASGEIITRVDTTSTVATTVPGRMSEAEMITNAQRLVATQSYRELHTLLRSPGFPDIDLAKLQISEASGRKTTLLHEAALVKSTATIETLFLCGASPFLRDSEGRLPREMVKDNRIRWSLENSPAAAEAAWQIEKMAIQNFETSPQSPSARPEYAGYLLTRSKLKNKLRWFVLNGTELKWWESQNEYDRYSNTVGSMSMLEAEPYRDSKKGDRIELHKTQSRDHLSLQACHKVEAAVWYLQLLSARRYALLNSTAKNENGEVTFHLQDPNQRSNQRVPLGGNVGL